MLMEVFVDVEEKLVGRHVVRFEDGDLFVLRIRGAILPGEMGALAREHDARLMARGRLLVLCDLREALPPDASARHELRDRPKNLPAHWIAYVGTPHRVGVVIDLIVRATSLLSSSNIVHRYFQDEPSARLWLADMRK